jgi:hypothetical protein
LKIKDLPLRPASTCATLLTTVRLLLGVAFSSISLFTLASFSSQISLSECAVLSVCLPEINPLCLYDTDTDTVIFEGVRLEEFAIHKGWLLGKYLQ